MGFKVPAFNVWCQVVRPSSPNPFQIHGWSRCQVRGTDSHSDPGPTPRTIFQILFPKYSDVRSFEQSPDGLQDFIQVAGWGARFARIEGVSDKGVGFSNEYRIAVVNWVSRDVGSPYNSVSGCGATDNTLEPPVGYTPLPLITKLGWAIVA